MNSRNYAGEATLVSGRKAKSKLPLILGCLGALALLFLIVIVGGFFYMTTSASGQSVVFIRAPQDGEILEADQPVQVSALARDDQKITRIELWVDGVLIDAQESNTQSGINPFPLLTTWYPQAGAHTLIVRAFNARGNSSQATITVGATALADRDLDGIADDADMCPDQPGSEAAGGCPDRDFDGVTDAIDACPDEAGLPPTGCPTPSASDRDGDGLLDAADACPDEVGSPLADGCPDADADGVADATDACPTEPGSGIDGCPDADGGLPPDPAPSGDPPPMPRPGDEPPIPDDDEEPESPLFEAFPLPEPDELPVQLEIEAYSLYIREAVERAWCYVQLGDEDPRRYDFEPEGEHMWNIAEEFAGENSVHLLHDQNEALSISLNCLGANEGEEPVAMEELAAVHPREEWDGRRLEMRPETENTIQVRYHICSPSCGETVLQTPLLAPITLGPTGNGPYLLRWRWEGNESEIDGFLFRRTSDTGAEDNIWVYDPGARSLDLADYMPSCGERIEFYGIVFRRIDGINIYSPPSNTVSWAADPCTYTANVTFTTLDVHNPPADEQGLHQPGPIYGEFWVSNGTTTEMLTFDACWCYFGPGSTFWGTCEGLELQSGTYSINRDIFGWIDRAKASCLGDGCRSNSFHAPFSSSLHIPFEDGDDLTIGGRVMDCDARNANDVVFEQQGGIRINIDDLDYLTVPLPFGLNGDHINLNSFIRMGR
ncbi:MAG: hypothetical protein HOC56_05720 [Anaerolineae bacterium]|nr:hypothetical protein [Anaerolineae bacterium]